MCCWNHVLYWLHAYIWSGKLCGICGRYEDRGYGVTAPRRLTASLSFIMTVAFAEDMRIVEPWYAHLGQAFAGVLLTLPYLVGRRRKAWLR